MDAVFTKFNTLTAARFLYTFLAFHLFKYSFLSLLRIRIFHISIMHLVSYIILTDIADHLKCLNILRFIYYKRLRKHCISITPTAVNVLKYFENSENIYKTTSEYLVQGYTTKILKGKVNIANRNICKFSENLL